MFFRSTIALFSLAICLVWSANAAAQDSKGGLLLQSYTKAPHGQAQPDGWLVLTAKVSNSSDEALTGTIVASVDGGQDTQSARTITFPPKSEEHLDIYVYVPRSLADQDSATFELTMYRMEGDREVMMDVGGTPMRYSLNLPIVRRPNMVFTVIEKEPPYQPYWHWPVREPHYNYELVVSSRVVSGHSRATVSLTPNTVPLGIANWGEVGLLVISDPELFDDASSVEQVKRFVNNGGRVWLMVDQVSCEAVRALLSGGQIIEEIDEIELNSFTVDTLQNSQYLSEADTQVSIDVPAKMKRVVQTGGTVTHAVNGWPVAIWMDVGYGQVLLTTLESRAWLQHEADEFSPLGLELHPRPWALNLSSEVHDVRHDKPLAKAVDYPLQFIGSPVLPRALVAAVLLSFVTLLAVIGALQWRKGDIRPFGWMAPSVSLIAGCVLFVGAGYIRRETSETSSSLQVIHLSGDGTIANVREQAAVYLGSERAMKLIGTNDGTAVADDNVQSGIKRFTHGDFQHWELSNANWPAGTWRYTSESVQEAEALRATAKLSEFGLRIDLPDTLAEPLEDPIVALARGTPMIGEIDGNSITADGSLIAEGDRWISGTLISDEQRRRLEVYQTFFEPDGRVSTPRAVLGWMPRWDINSWNSDALSRAGSALVSLPVRLLRPELGQKILLPSGLVELRKNATLLSRTSVYSEVTGKWSSDVALAIEANLQFVLPPEVLPFAAESITIDLDIKAPHRTVRLLSTSGDGQPIEIVKLDGPSIPWRGEVTDPRILDDARDGLIDILLEVSERDDLDEDGNAITVVTWNIESFRASLRGSRTSE